MSEFFTFTVIGGIGIATYAVVRAPSWLFASMNRGTLWQLRDCIFDARRSGHLPDVPEVDLLLRRTELMIVFLPATTALQIWWLEKRGYINGAPTPANRTLKLSTCEPDQQRFFLLLQDELRRGVLRHYLACSWSGLLLVVPRHFAEFRTVLKRRHDVREWLDHQRELPDPPEAIGTRYDEIVDVVEQVKVVQEEKDDRRRLSQAAA